MDYKEMFDQELISLELKGENEVEVFQQVAKQLTELGFVNEGYLNGIITREEKFPTGLITQHVNIALPHSDPEYVEKPFVYIARLKDEVKVKQMGDSQEMKVKNLFFLGIKDPKGQVGLLQAFMELFMKEEFVTEFINEKDINKIYQLFTNNI
ncbi:PTS sugar transporter subunit IIA [Enterococcus devriesei]|nr:PTS sugar transporter subunit IIA [Enterococcus devriesei]